MSCTKASIEVVLDPARALHLEKFRSELDAASNRYGGRCRAETLRRDGFGLVVRDGVLNLPSRFDLNLRNSGGSVCRNFDTSRKPSFRPVDVLIDDKLKLRIFPFSWDDVRITFDTGDDPKRLLRVRLWFLEWFQARFTNSCDGLHGVVHSITGPKHERNLWQIAIDMGSAPTAALVELFHILASRGVSQMTLGAELDHAER